MVVLPEVRPVNVTGQLPADDKMQLAPTVPTTVLDETKLTVPDGILAAFVVSATVAVMIAVQLVAPDATVQLTELTVVVVLSFTTVIMLDVPELAR